MVTPVSQILSHDFNVNILPGKKVNCPFCNHKTFQVKQDDSLGKCFHPLCGRFVTRFHGGHKNSLDSILGEIFHDFHRYLMTFKNRPLPIKRNDAYSYLVEKRMIHPQVVADSMLGAVPPKYNLKEKFDLLVEELENKIKAEEEKEEPKKKKGRPKKSKNVGGNTLNEKLASITEAQQKLQECINGNTGWLCFFYTNEFHQIVSIRFRKPYAKNIFYFKPFKSAGLFGHGLFFPYMGENLKDCNEHLVVVEGEFNQLQLQSLSLRFGESTNQETGYILACAVGGVNNADYKTIRKIARFPYFCYDNDSSGAGFVLVEKALDKMSCRAFTSPNPETDLDDFIRVFGKKYEDAWEG